MNESGRREKNIIWEYFEKVDEENKDAECKLCHSLLNYRSTSHNLQKHIKNKHTDVNIPTPKPVPAKTKKMRKNRSSVWEYFEVSDNEKKIASCNECMRTISYKTTTANLKTHLRRVHKQKYAEMEGLEEEGVYVEDNGDESVAQDDVWSFFERAGGEARCAVCREMVPISALRSHLRNNHPKLVDIVESEEETTNNTQEEVYTEVVYLEHEDSPRRAKPIEKPRKPKKYIEKTPIKRRASSSSEGEPLLQAQHKKTRNDDEIEHFGKYITCLLKNIPQETSMELQMEIVNLIMKRQLELKRNETSVLAGCKMAAVQVQTEDDCQTASFEIIKVRDEKSLGNGYTYSIEKIVNEETVQSDE